MGIKIALTGLIVFIFSAFIFTACGKTKSRWGVNFWARICFVSLLSIPIGLIAEVWM